MTFNLKQCALVCGALALAATSAAARTVVDDNGTSVEIPDHVNRVVVTNILPQRRQDRGGHASRLLLGRQERAPRQALS